MRVLAPSKLSVSQKFIAKDVPSVLEVEQEWDMPVETFSI